MSSNPTKCIFDNIALLQYFFNGFTYKGKREMTTFAIPHRHTRSTTFGQEAHIRAMSALLEEKNVRVGSLVRVEGRSGTFKVHHIDQFQRITLATACGVVLRDSVSPRALSLAT